MKRDQEIFDLIADENERQTLGIELIASENYVSKQVMEAMGSCLTNKYAEGYPGKRYYGGCEVVDQVEQLAIDRLKLLFGVEYANVQPHSGSQANAAVYLACLSAGDMIMGFDLAHGGHLTHGSPVNFSGIQYNTCFYGVSKETGIIDYEAARETAIKHSPKLIICGASSYTKDIEYAKFRAIADEVGALLMADISHPSGLIAKGILNDPVPHCHIITSTTHKTLRGPRGGIIMMGSDFPNPLGKRTAKGATKKMSTLLNAAVFPGTQGGPLEHIIAAKAVAFGEALSDDFMRYTLQIVKNAKALSQELTRLGYHTVSGETENHVILIDLRSNTSISGKEAEERLGWVDITVNKNMVPFDDKSPFVTSGIRVGTPAITTRGMNEKDMSKVAEFIDKALKIQEQGSESESLREEVNTWMSSFSTLAQ